MYILLTGGLGFIGSHTAIILSNNGYNVIIFDNLSNSKMNTLDSIKMISNNPNNIYFHQGDVTNKNELSIIFTKYNIDSVIHFASLKSVNQSIDNPLLYYKQNLNGMIILLEVMKEYNCMKLIFSSSATVYGNMTEKFDTMTEDIMTGVGISNPYGQTKYFIEQILLFHIKANPNMKITILRYFNPVGAHPSGLIGENPNDIPNNIFPYLLNVAIGKYKELSIFGKDYTTPDGTCIRDFIHVMDLAEGHYVAMQHINENDNMNVYNLGTGIGTSVLELVNTFERVNNIKINYKFSDKRQGDAVKSCANVTKIYKMLGWKTKFTIEDICRDGYNYITRNK
jgi:UDP-glucose 4-epimerase